MRFHALDRNLARALGAVSRFEPAFAASVPMWGRDPTVRAHCKYPVPVFFFVRFATERPCWTGNRYRRPARPVLTRRFDADASRSRGRVWGPSTYWRRCGDDRGDRDEAGPEDCGPDQSRDQAMDDDLDHGGFSRGKPRHPEIRRGRDGVKRNRLVVMPTSHLPIVRPTGPVNCQAAAPGFSGGRGGVEGR